MCVKEVNFDHVVSVAADSLPQPLPVSDTRDVLGGIQTVLNFDLLLIWLKAFGKNMYIHKTSSSALWLQTDDYLRQELV